MKKILLLALLLGPLAARAGLLSEFSCVRPRAVDEGTWHNVSLAAALVNGVVLGPGETFSFLKLMAGHQGQFAPGNTFSSGRVIKSVGGGYCQVSTSVYNAVLLAGLPILERYAHSFYDAEDAYVEPGRDAAVSGSHADFRFLNSSAAPLTLAVTALAGRVSVQVFGAGKPRKRWFSAETVRVPMGHLSREGLAKRPGHDGLTVRRQLNVVDDSGNTRSIFLGVDHYDMVTAYE